MHGHKRQKGEVKGERVIESVHKQSISQSPKTVTQLLPIVQDGQTGVHFNSLKTEMDE